MMAFLAGRGRGTIVARFTPTDRNAPARQFLDSIGRAQDGIVYPPRSESARA